MSRLNGVWCAVAAAGLTRPPGESFAASVFVVLPRGGIHAFQRDHHPRQRHRRRQRGARIIIAARERFGPVQAVLMSGDATSGFAGFLGSDERVTLIQKPIEFGHLARAVRRALDGHPG